MKYTIIKSSEVKELIKKVNDLLEKYKGSEILGNVTVNTSDIETNYYQAVLIKTNIENDDNLPDWLEKSIKEPSNSNTNRNNDNLPDWLIGKAQK